MPSAWSQCMCVIDHVSDVFRLERGLAEGMMPGWPTAFRRFD